MIQCDNIELKYSLRADEYVKALDKVSLTIKKGEFIALIGPNGSGKSTLAQCLAGLLTVTSGSITVNGQDIVELIKSHEIRSIVGMVFQNPDDQLISNFVEREVAFALEYRGVQRDEMITRVENVLKRFNLDSLKGRSPNQLSGGQKQKLALASVMIAHPTYLFLDEPTSFLDYYDRKQIMRQLRDESGYSGDKRLSILLVTQYSREAVLCDRVIVMDRGRIVADKPPQLLFSEDQELLNSIGVDIPIEYRFNAAVQHYSVSSDIFDFSSS